MSTITFEDCAYYANGQYFAGMILGLTTGFIFGHLQLFKRILFFVPESSPFDFEDASCIKTPNEEVIEAVNDLDERVVNEIKNSDPLENLTRIFEDEVEDRKSQAVRRGRELGEEPTLASLNKGGYLTNADLDELKNRRDTFKRLTRTEEIDIISDFRDIEGKTLDNARDLASERGYSLFVNSVGDTTRCREIYSGAVLGVEISDPEYNYEKNEPSNKARVTDILNVGGLLSTTRSDEMDKNLDEVMKCLH